MSPALKNTSRLRTHHGREPVVVTTPASIVWMSRPLHEPRHTKCIVCTTAYQMFSVFPSSGRNHFVARECASRTEPPRTPAKRKPDGRADGQTPTGQTFDTRAGARADDRRNDKRADRRTNQEPRIKPSRAENQEPTQAEPRRAKPSGAEGRKASLQRSVPNRLETTPNKKTRVPHWKRASQPNTTWHADMLHSQH